MTLVVDNRNRPWHTAGGRRRLSVFAELLLAVAVCFAGYRYAASWFQVNEARWVAGALRLLGLDRVSGVLPGHILVFRTGGGVLNAEVTASCSAVLSVLGLTALTLTVLRSRRLHAVVGLVAAAAGVVLLNDLRLAFSTVAGLWWGKDALLLFHDWVGTVWTFASTLVGFLLMVCLTLPAAERAEQNVAGHHTARRPNSWARPGLGYRLPELDDVVPTRRRTLTGLMHRYVLPKGVSRRLAASREAGRVDYRIGHLPPEERIERVRGLTADGLGAHVATLLAVATYDQDVRVLDALADEVAARQWEPVVNDRVAAVRLWARGWLAAREPGLAPPGDDGGAETDELPAPDDTRILQAPRPRPPAAARPRRATPRSFARPPAADPRPEDIR